MDDTAYRGHRRNAFSVLELLVVIAILALLAALLQPAFRGVRRRAQLTGSIHNLKQIGVAFKLYTDDFGRRPTRLYQLAHCRYVPPDVLLSPGDPFTERGGWAGFHDQRVFAVEPPWPMPVSYWYPRFCGESDRYWQLIQRRGRQTGYVVDVLFGELEAAPDRFTGRVLRLCFNGSVIVTHVDQAPHSTDYWKLCTGEEDPR